MTTTQLRNAAASSPFVKWAGGKRQLVPQILPLLPKTFRRYFEPFLGGGAVFFATQPSSATLADDNEDLINCYVQVRDRPEQLISVLSGMSNTERDYYEVRSKIPADAVERAARLIYLTTLSFNGIHRLNQSGEFNVPYGRKLHVQPCDPLKIRAASRALAGTDLRCSDFEASVQSAEAGDLIYLDPPYTVAHGTNGFLKYNARIFSWEDQERLASIARTLAAKGCHVVISNADHSSIHELYKDFNYVTVRRHSRVAALGVHRRSVTECILFHLREAPDAQ